MKRITSLYLDYEIVQTLLKKGINVSNHVNNFLKTELGIKQLTDKETETFELKRKLVMTMDNVDELRKELKELKKEKTEEKDTPKIIQTRYA